MSVDEVVLNRFFSRLRSLLDWYIESTDLVPTKLVISPQTLQKLSKLSGFYQRAELGTEVTIHAPLVRRFKLTTEIVVEIVEDVHENFLHFE